jgi:CheY-like chemotaxis protein
MSSHVKILTIDDEASVRMSIRNFLEDYDYDVMEADNGRIGLEIFEQRTPHIVLVDLRMPEMGGLEVLREIRRRSADTPVIVISGTGQIQDAVEALRLGAWDYLLKPIQNLSILRHSVEKCLERRRLILQNRRHQEELEEKVTLRTRELERANQELYASQQALQTAKDELEQRVEERTREILKANQELETAKATADAAVMAKSNFLANMSHEIRTPLNGVIAAADLALNETVPPKIEHLLRIIHSCGYALMGIVNNVLDFSKIEAGKLELDIHPFQLMDVLDSVTSLSLNKVTEKQIELLVDIEPDTPMSLEGDKLRIQQILTNLLDNAIKFTPKNGIIIMGAAESGNFQSDAHTELRFFVKDTGVGMTPDQQVRLFQPFTQADSSTTRKYGGSGLGLSICKKLTEIMGGRIWFESESGKGTAFYFILPLKRQARKVQKKFVVPDDLQRLRVLVVDDCADTRNLMHKLLTSFRLQIEMAVTGADALDKMRKASDLGSGFDLIIMDWIMPEMDGLESVKKIREDLKSDIPIIMMSAFARESEMDESDRHRINGFLNKPFHPSSLFNAIMDLFGKDLSADAHPRGIYPMGYGYPDGYKSGAGDHFYKERLKGMRVLITEDNLTSQEITRALLETSGVSVHIAGNGKQALKSVQLETYDAILMDIQMPVMDGLEATRKIREYETRIGVRTPIIAMTAHAVKGDEAMCRQAGMDDYVSKPIDREILLRTLCRQVPRKPAEHPMDSIPNKDPAHSTDDEIPDTLPGIAVREALDRLDITPDIYKSILQIFYDTHHDAAERVEKDLRAENWKSLRDLAHGLKGSAANIQAHRVRSAALELETASKNALSNGQAPDKILLEELTGALNQVFEAIRSLAAAAPGLENRPVETDPSEIIMGLKKLTGALERSDPDEIQHCLRQVKKYVGGMSLRSIENSILHYDYNEAIEDLRKMTTDLEAAPE